MNEHTTRQIRRSDLPLLWRGAAVLSLLLPLLSSAQDTKTSSCVVNGDHESDVCISEVEAPTGEAEAAHLLDWVQYEEVPEQLRDARCALCGGRYIDPLAGDDQHTSPEQSNIEARARRTEVKDETVLLEEGVVVRQGYRHLRSDTALINHRDRTATLKGNVQVREPGLLLQGEQAEIHSQSGETSLTNSDYVLHEQNLRGSADLLHRDEKGVIHIHGADLTFCAPEDSDWNLRANELELDIEEGLGTARGARLEIGGVPLFYTPWLQLPIDDRRRSGLLWPDIGTDSKGGLDFSLPVYWNIAPHYDALYTPRLIQERGLNHQLQLRHLNRHLGKWTVGGAWMADDDRYRDEFPNEKSSDRWLGVVKHHGLFDQRWRSEVDFSKASDVNYMKDLEASGIDAKRRTALQQMASVDYLGDNWLIDAEVQRFQSLADDLSDDYQKVPQLTARYRPSESPFRLQPIFMAQYSSFDTADDRVTGQRLYTEAGVGYPMNWVYGFLQPSAKYRQLHYELDDHPDFSDSQPSAGTGTFSLDGGLYFDRQTSFAGKKLQQTLEPRLFYLYSGYEDQRDQPDFDSAELTFSYNQLFRDTRFSGHDRLDDSNQLSVGITTRFIDDIDGNEYLSATIGQIIYFEDYQVRLNAADPVLDNSRSELAAELDFTPNDRLDLTSRFIWDQDSGRMNSVNIQSTYRWHDENIINLGYTFRRPLETLVELPNNEQVYLSTYLPINRRWAFYSSLNYSLEAHTSVEDMVGVEYDNCCWKVRLLHLRYYDSISGLDQDFDSPDLQREYSTQLQIILKGMGGFGSRITSIMEDMIRGFEDIEH